LHDATGSRERPAAACTAATGIVRNARRRRRRNGSNPRLAAWHDRCTTGAHVSNPAPRSRIASQPEDAMTDLGLLLIVVAFFAVCVAYARGLDRI
jgi:hypothetical protein